MSPAQTLSQLDTRADLVFKGTVISDVPTLPLPQSVQPGPFFGPGGYAFGENLTQFRIVSVVKGGTNGNTVAFRHYEDPAHGSPEGRFGFERVRYHFEPGRTYLVFARKTGTAGIYGQVSDGPCFKTDEGALRCANDKPVSANTIHEIVWNELVTMLHSGDPGDAEYALYELDQMSGGSQFYHGEDGVDFQRQDVSELVHGLITDADSRIARMAIAAIGSHNPYMDEARAANWMAEVGAVPAPGMSKMGKRENVGGAHYWHDLAAVADGKGDGTTRALAVAALGLVCQEGVQSHLERWLTDPDAGVRSSAAVLLADYPTMATRERITKLAADPDSEVVAAVARSIGFGQHVEFADILAALLRHPDLKVRKYAAMSLLSFSPKSPGVAAVMEANLDNSEFSGQFTNALASEHPEKYLNRLAKIAGDMLPPQKGWWGGEPPGSIAWETLFNYLQVQPSEALQSGRFDACFDAMEKAKIGSIPNKRLRAKLLEFYEKAGLTARAQKLSKEDDN